jgi:hypothetical protein
MNASICAARASYLDRMVRNSAQRFFQSLLHAEASLLPLPTVVRRTVVLNAERNAQWISCSAN